MPPLIGSHIAQLSQLNTEYDISSVDIRNVN